MPLDAPVTIREFAGHVSSPQAGDAIETGLEHDLGHFVLLVVEHLVALGRLLERQPVGDQEGRYRSCSSRIALSSARHVVLHMGLAGLERQPLLHEGAQRELVDEAAIDCRHRDAPTLAAGDDRLADRMRRGPCRGRSTP